MVSCLFVCLFVYLIFMYYHKQRLNGNCITILYFSIFFNFFSTTRFVVVF